MSCRRTAADHGWVTIINLVAIASKGLGVYVASRWAGESPSEARQIAALLNARGAMEIVAAHYALQSQIINPTQYVALLLLAILSSVVALPVIRSA